MNSKEDIEALVIAAKAASNYIHFIGANHTERGLPHPQELLLKNLDEAIEKFQPNGDN